MPSFATQIFVILADILVFSFMQQFFDLLELVALKLFHILLDYFLKDLQYKKSRKITKDA